MRNPWSALGHVTLIGGVTATALSFLPGQEPRQAIGFAVLGVVLCLCSGGFYVLGSQRPRSSREEQD